MFVSTLANRCGLGQPVIASSTPLLIIANTCTSLKFCSVSVFSSSKQATLKGRLMSNMMVSPYYLLLRYDALEADKSAIVYGTYRERVDDPSDLSTAPAHVNVDLDEYRLAREDGEWRFRRDRSVYKE